MARRTTIASANSNGHLPVLVLLSNDDQLAETVEAAAQSEWSVLRSAYDQVSGLIREPNVKLVIFDDQSVSPSERGRALSEIRRCASKAPIVYVAGQHDLENERQARTRGVLFYTGKPLMQAHVMLLLQRLMQMQNGKRDLAQRQNHGQG
jgi:DNA-binding NtrC family response regulator